MNEQEIRDFNRKHSGTVVLLESKDEKAVFKIGELMETPEGLVLTASDKNNKHRNLLYKDWTFFARPRARVFDFNGDTYIYKHRPERQWSRGICESNSTIISVSEYLRSFFPVEYWHNPRGEKRYGLFSTAVIDGLFHSEPAGLEKAVQSILSGEALSKTVNERFYVSSSFKPKNLYLWLMGNLIGEIIPESNSILVTNKIFVQEVSDIVKREGINYHVI